MAVEFVRINNPKKDGDVLVIAKSDYNADVHGAILPNPDAPVATVAAGAVLQSAPARTPKGFVRIVDPKKPSDYRIIAALEFDPTKHTLIDEPPDPVAAVVVPVPIQAQAGLLKVKDPKKPGDYLLVGPKDFDPQVHELFEEPASAANSSSEPPLREDGPTFEEYVAAGYAPDTYPPTGYAERPSPGLDAYRAQAPSVSTATNDAAPTAPADPAPSGAKNGRAKK